MHDDEFTIVDGRRVPTDLVNLFSDINQGKMVEAANKLRTFWAFDVESMVKAFGYELLGQGAFSTVFAIPGQPDVIKMNHNPDDRWNLYAEFAKQNAPANSLLPKVHEMYQNEENGMMIARMERLEPIGLVSTVGMSDVIKFLSADLRQGSMTKRGIRNRTLNYLQTKFDFGYKGHYSRINLAKIVIWMTQLVMKNRYDCRVDCHYGNWMLRGNELVLNDPLAS